MILNKTVSIDGLVDQKNKKKGVKLSPYVMKSLE